MGFGLNGVDLAFVWVEGISGIWVSFGLNGVSGMWVEWGFELMMFGWMGR